MFVDMCNRDSLNYQIRDCGFEFANQQTYEEPSLVADQHGHGNYAVDAGDPGAFLIIAMRWNVIRQICFIRNDLQILK